MRSQTRYVILLITILTTFSLYTIVKNKPTSNYQLEPGESTVRYDEADESRFLEEGHEEPLPQLHDASKIDRTLPSPERSTIQFEGSHKPLASLLDVLAGSEQVEKFDFRSCRMLNCFDFSRCRSNETLRVHISTSQLLSDREPLNISGESNIIHNNILKIIRESDYFEPDLNKACIIVVDDDTLDRDPLSSSFRHSTRNLFDRKQQFGMNHLIFNLYSGSWPDYREDDFSGIKIGAAILAKASDSQSNHRMGFDISIPLFSYLHPIHELETNLDENSTSSSKLHFLTFKGKRYVIGSGSETRNSLYHLNNQRDVVMLTTCKHGKKWRDTKDARCAEEELSYNKYDFVDLMKNSTFCLTPRGRRLGSFRFLEALNHGCIPVVLSDGWVWPFDEIIDWSDAAIQFPEDQILLVPDMLRDIGPEQIARMRKKCQLLYRRHFSTVKKIVLTTLSIIESRIRNKLS